MFKYLVIFFISCFIVPLVFSQQNPETVTITTYYPAPFGVYQSLQLYPTNPAPDTCATATDLGKIYYNNSSYQLMLCQQDSTGNINWQNIGAGYWTINGNNLYPNDNNWNVGIGTTTPQAKLDVAGETKIGNSGLACSVDTAGAMRYNTGVTPARMEYCNGASWNVFVGLRPTYVDNNDRGPATFQQAFNQCKSEGKYLPKAEELLYFIFGGAGAYSNITTNYLWTITPEDARSAFVIVVSGYIGGNMGNDHTGVWSYDPAATAYYRCVK